MPFSGQVVSINIAAGQGEPMQSLDSAAVAAGSGIEGDRYAQGLGKFSAKEGPDRQVTLIESEAVEAVTQETGIELTPEQTRRNIVTRDVPLNHLVGREFSVGDVVLRGLRLNEPCAYLASLTTEGVSRALVHRGGLRAEVVRGGTIRVGDPITPAL